MKTGISDLEKYFRNNDKRMIRKWNHYFDIYERHFSRYRGKDVVILEIGVSQGGSLQMWKDYFGNNAKIYGIDIDPRCKSLEEENIKIFIGSQSDRKFLRQVRKAIPPIDILIDDGGHMMRHQIVSFEELFDHVKEEGVYLCEDTHTSYWLRYGGGYKRPQSYIEYSKNFIDYLHAYHSEQRHFKVNSFTQSVDSVHFYDSVVVVEKMKREAPGQDATGNISFENPVNLNRMNKIRKKSIKFALIFSNKTLRFLRLPGLFWR